MKSEYEIRLSGRVVSRREASTARLAAFDYLRSIGCPSDEIRPVAVDAVAWRGAIYRAALPDGEADGAPA